MATAHVIGCCQKSSLFGKILYRQRGGDAMAVSYKIIGRHIRAARKVNNLTQEQVAEAMKISVAHYGRLERGEREINLERLSEISVLLNTPIEYFVEGSVPNAPTIIDEKIQKNTFLNQMAQFAQFCQEDTLQRMLRICGVLADEDRDFQ